jgi:hypothetical protein
MGDVNRSVEYCDAYFRITQRLCTQRGEAGNKIH